MGHFRDVLLTLITLATLALLVWIFAAGTADAQDTYSYKSIPDSLVWINDSTVVVKPPLLYGNTEEKYSRCPETDEHRTISWTENVSYVGGDHTGVSLCARQGTIAARTNADREHDGFLRLENDKGIQKKIYTRVRDVLPDTYLISGKVAFETSDISKEEAESQPVPSFRSICENDRPLPDQLLNNCRSRFPHLVQDIPYTLGNIPDPPQALTLFSDVTVRAETPYPNPANPSTIIQFVLPSPAHVRLTVYDMLGREVYKLADGPQAAGRHEYRFDGSRLPSGTYVYVLEVDGHASTKTFTLIK